MGSLHSVCRVLTKYVPPTFSRTHLEAAGPAPETPGAAERGLGGPGTPPATGAGPGLGVRPRGGPSAAASSAMPGPAQRRPAAITARRFRFPRAEPEAEPEGGEGAGLPARCSAGDGGRGSR